MVEPSNAFLHRFMVRRFHPHECFDADVRDWSNSARGRMTGANNALPWVMFVRDRSRFEREFPSLRIRRIEPHTFLAYYASGGLSFRPFLPEALYPVLCLLELLARPFSRWLGTMMTVDIEKV